MCMCRKTIAHAKSPPDVGKLSCCSGGVETNDSRLTEGQGKHSPFFACAGLQWDCGLLVWTAQPSAPPDSALSAHTHTPHKLTNNIIHRQLHLHTPQIKSYINTHPHHTNIHIKSYPNTRTPHTNKIIHIHTNIPIKSCTIPPPPQSPAFWHPSSRLCHNWLRYQSFLQVGQLVFISWALLVELQLCLTSCSLQLFFHPGLRRSLCFLQLCL